MKAAVLLENIVPNLQAFLQNNAIASPSDMRLLLQYIQGLLKGEKAIFPLSKDKKIWQETIDALFEDEILQNTIHAHPELEMQVLQHIADFLSQAAKKTQLQNTLILQEEESAFIELELLPLEIFAANYPPYFQSILRYNAQDLNLDFYAQRIALAVEKKDWQRLGDLKTFLLSEWRIILEEKRLAAQLAIIANDRANFMLHFADKVEAYENIKQALQPLTQGEDLGRFWDLGKSIWNKSNTQVLSYYAAQLEQNPIIKKMAALLGKMRQAKNEYILEKIKSTNKSKIWQEDLRQKESYIGLTLSDDIALAMPSEWALLSDTQTEDLFIKSWIEKKLQTWEYSSQYLSEQDFESEKAHKILKPQDKGPIIICVDTSASMEGAPEQIAKTLCFAIVQNAIKEKRPCFLISFSTTIKTLDLHAIQSALPELIAFLSMSFHGGTDAIPALKKAMETVYTKTYKKADIMMISDFVMDNIGKGILAGMQEMRQKLDTQFYALSITNEYNKSAASHFDAHWAYNPNDKNNLLQLIHLLSSTKPSE